MQCWCWCTILELKITLWVLLFHRYTILFKFIFHFVSHMHSPPFVRLASVHKTELDKIIISEMLQHMFRSPYLALGTRHSELGKKEETSTGNRYHFRIILHAIQSANNYLLLLTQTDECASTYYRAICLNISNNNECV